MYKQLKNNFVNGMSRMTTDFTQMTIAYSRIPTGDTPIDSENERLGTAKIRINFIQRHPYVITGLTLFFVVNVILFNKLTQSNLSEYQDYNGYLINLEGCQIPNFNLLDSNILKYVEKPAEIICENDQYKAPLFDGVPSKNLIKFKKTALKNSWGFSISEISCCYRSFRRGPVVNEKSDLESVSFSNDCVLLNLENETAYIKDEFIQVKCKIKEDKMIFYKDFFSFVPKKVKDTPVLRIENEQNPIKSKMALNSDLDNSYLNIEQSNTNSKKLSVLIMGIDSISRLNLHRQLPITVDYLINEKNAIEMLGYNKVGENTFPNLMPILAGLTAEEIKEGCLNDSYDSRFDDCPFVWKTYKSKGYTTLYAEDSTHLGLFNYLCKGFRDQPTDYDYRIFDFVAANETVHEMYDSNICLGARMRYKVLMSYMESFLQTIEKDPFFALYWTVSLSHEYLNFPNLGDKDFQKFLKDNYFGKGHDERTVLIFLSDHGIRWGKFRETLQGKYEERLPYLLFHFPKWFSKKYPIALQNLRNNVNKLSTPFDLHETLVDLSDLSRIDDAVIYQRTSIIHQPTLRGLSLFLPIPTNRTCETARIPDHFCTCQKVVYLDPNSSITRKLTEYLISHIHNLLSGFNQCAKLQLNSITSITKNQHLGHLTSDSTVNDYTIVFETIPGNALFEGSLRKIDGRVILSNGTAISRLNLYGNQSRCVNDAHLKLYCFCQ